ncbi:MAG: folate-binding protein [Ferrovibrio sp.]|uniref:CAF17-like 4Fe-4S cluster assembly/insertion protein YgfZ n=1 Tax=Ferrovibrio sp. TaxID=1917215 RepID=UPI00261DBA38|nr:folate-binding protein [Ferrovibrio sp.]MCW0236130.1 folate-binding protein [Ferrovibrio sp.]
MADLTCVALPDRALLSVAGEEAAGFLDALVSNSVAGLERGQAAYAALLSPQGKFLHDFFVIPDLQSQGLLLDVAAERLPDLQRRLTMYRLRAKVSISVVEGFRCYGLFGNRQPDIDNPLFFPDPRLAQMGWRLWQPASALPPLPLADFVAYEAHRIALGVPDGARDIEIDKGLLLENHFEALHGVDFRKGCYIGQELTARTKYRGLVKKQLSRVQGTQPLPPSGTPITANGQEAGQLRSVSGSIGLALLRLDAVSQDLDAAGVALTAQRPDYAGPIPEAKT